MLVTNNTNQDYWFGPLHIGPNATNVTVDDTSATSLYLTDDSVADAINFLYQQNKISVSGAAAPFPRPTGTPDLLHGDGSPEGLVYASEGSLYLRRDNANLYQKRTMVHINTGWTQLGQAARDQIKRLGLGYRGESFDKDGISAALAFTSGDLRVAAVGLLAGDTITNVLVDVTAAGAVHEAESANELTPVARFVVLFPFKQRRWAHSVRLLRRPGRDSRSARTQRQRRNRQARVGCQRRSP